jgi:predicted XRE-type DNA-binding protein
MTQAELDIQTKAFLEQTSHMQILGDPKNPAQGAEVNVSELRQDLNAAVLESVVGEMLRQARLQRGLTGEQAGALFGVKRARVSQMETSGDVLQLQTLVQYAQSLDFDVQLSLIPRNGGSVLTRELH